MVGKIGNARDYVGSTIKKLALPINRFLIYLQVRILITSHIKQNTFVIL